MLFIFDDFPDDSTKATLQRALLPKGSGRPPSLPPLPASNRVLLQLYSIRLEAGKTWKDLHSWLAKLYPDWILKEGSIPKLFEGILSKAESISPVDRPAFFDDVINYNSIGQF